MIMKDFQCGCCGTVFEDLVNSDTVVASCPSCTRLGHYIASATRTITAFIPTYPGCKKRKAGYMHTSHADHPGTKIQSGWTAAVGL